MVMGEFYHTLSSVSLREQKSTSHHQPEFVRSHRRDFHIWFPFSDNLLHPVEYLCTHQNAEDPHPHPIGRLIYLLNFLQTTAGKTGEQSKLSKGAIYTALKIIIVCNVILTLSVLSCSSRSFSDFTFCFVISASNLHPFTHHLWVIRAGIIFPISRRTWSQVQGRT